MPEGKVLISGLNPGALGCPARAGAAGGDAANATRGIAYLRLRDWLRLLELRDRGGALRLPSPHHVQQALAAALGLDEPCGSQSLAHTGRCLLRGGRQARAGHAAAEPGWRTRVSMRQGRCPWPSASIVEIQGYEV
jgi:hypothetical protein